MGPIAQGGVGEQERRALRSCYWNSLQTATENAARSVVRTSGRDASDGEQPGRERGTMTDEVKIQKAQKSAGDQQRTIELNCRAFLCGKNL